MKAKRITGTISKEDMEVLTLGYFPSRGILIPELAKITEIRLHPNLYGTHTVEVDCEEMLEPKE